jgi:hypothetical protein
MHPNRERLYDLWKRAATTTYLRGVLRVNCDDSHPSFFRFGCEYVQKSSPARVVNRLRKAGPGDASDVEGFVGYQVVPPYQLAGLLVVEVLPLVGRLFVQARHALTSFAAPVRAFLLSRERTLRPPELFLRVLIVTRGLYGLAIGGRKEALQSEVNADSLTLSSSCGSLAYIADENGVPLAARPLDGDGLDLSLDWPVQLDLDVPNVLEIEPFVLLEPATVAVGWELDEPETVPTFEARIPRTFSSFDSAEEGSEGAVQSAERGLRAGEVGCGKIRIALTSLLELAGLLAIGDGSFLRFVNFPTLFERRVVQAAVSLKHLVESFGLRTIGIETIFEGFPHRLIVSDGARIPNAKVSKGGERGFLHRLKQTILTA